MVGRLMRAKRRSHVDQALFAHGRQQRGDRLEGET
jgi:hypothetical protein